MTTFYCGRAFSPKAHSSRYCSEACRIEGRRRRVRECARRYMADPEKLAAATARRRAVNARRRAMAGMKKRPVHDGPSAGRPLPAAAPGTIAYRLCGRGFAPYGGARRVYCKPCTDRTDGEVGGARLARCRVCGGEFSTTHRIVKYCSTACGGEARRRKAREYDRRRMADPDRRAAAAARRRSCAARRDRKAEPARIGRRQARDARQGSSFERQRRGAAAAAAAVAVRHPRRLPWANPKCGLDEADTCP